MATHYLQMALKKEIDFENDIKFINDINELCVMQRSLRTT